MTAMVVEAACPCSAGHGGAVAVNGGGAMGGGAEAWRWAMMGHLGGGGAVVAAGRGGCRRGDRRRRGMGVEWWQWALNMAATW